MTLACHPGWLRPYESLWSLVCKLAFVHECTLLVALNALRSAFEPIQIWTWGEGYATTNLESRLDATFRNLPTTSLARYVRVPGDYADIRRAVHYCDECLYSFYHSVLLQHRSVVECPLHRRPLSNSCSTCGIEVCYFAGMPWKCSVCGTPFTRSDPQRFDLYRTPISHEPFDELAQQLTSLTQESRARRECEEKTGVVLLTDEPVTVDYWSWDTARGHRYLAQQYLSAVSDLTLGLGSEHLKCVRTAWALQDNSEAWQRTGTRYSCSIGFAIARTAKHLGLRPEVQEGWPVDRQATFKAAAALMQYLSCSPGVYLGPQAVNIVIGALARSRFAEALAVGLPKVVDVRERLLSEYSTLAASVQWELIGSELRLGPHMTSNAVAELAAREHQACRAACSLGT